MPLRSITSPKVLMFFTVRTVLLMRFLTGTKSFKLKFCIEEYITLAL